MNEIEQLQASAKSNLEDALENVQAMLSNPAFDEWGYSREYYNRLKRTIQYSIDML